MNTPRPSILRHVSVTTLVCLGGIPPLTYGQSLPNQQQLSNQIGDRVEALTLLGGDYGLSGGRFRSTGKFLTGGDSDSQLNVTKLGGSGDIGDPQQVGGLDLGWQPHLQGNLGFLQSENHLHTPLLEGDLSTIDTRAAEFGGGARFWLTEHFSAATTLLALYGRTSNTYTANSSFMRANLTRAIQAGLIDWKLDTWSAATALDFQYKFLWNRSIVTLSSDPTWFRTRSTHSSNINVNANGDSGSVANKIEIDTPIGLQLFDHELRTGGYFSRTDLFGGLKEGLSVPHLYEVHGRLTLDMLDQVWKVQWAGIGISYIWGPGMKGWTAGADVTFRF